MRLSTYKIRKLTSAFNWRLLRAHSCTAAVAVGFVGTWRLPRDAFRYGGVTTALLFTIAMGTVCLSAALLQVSIGQLSQQDVVGVWRAVPFCTGVGYLRLLASFLCSVCTVIYVALCVTYFFFTLSNSIYFWDCSEHTDISESNLTLQNTSTCLNATLLAPVDEEPEYYVATALIIIVLWVLLPFVFYHPVKTMKRVFYFFAPLVIFLGTIILICVGERRGLSYINKSTDWLNLGKPVMWHGAVSQALLSAHIAGGYLITSGDTIYTNTDVEWTTITFIGANVVTSWIGLIFWYSIGGESDKDTSNLAVLVQTLMLSIDKQLNLAWPLLIFAMLICSGAITMLTLLYPISERIRRVGGRGRRYVAAGGVVAAVAISLTVAAGGSTALVLLEELVVPFLISLSTSLEVSAFVFIYGWKVLVEDVEFLIERKLARYWVWGLCAAPGIIMPLTIWWSVSWFIEEPDWTQPPWAATGLVVTISLALVILLICAAISIAKQVQYDVVSKLKSSFQPSRHWGPRDPITHYYWLMRRDESARNLPHTRYRRRKIGIPSGGSSLLHVSNNSVCQESTIHKKRANSDDLLYLQRKESVAEIFQLQSGNRQRSKSLDWTVISKINSKSKGYIEHKNIDCELAASVVVEKENNNNIINNEKNSVVDN